MKEGTEVKMWCRYYLGSIKEKIYDSSTLAYTRKRSKELYKLQFSSMSSESISRVMKDSLFEKVTVTINKAQ